MHQILNTLYVTTQQAYVHLDHDTLRVEVEGATQLQVPLHHLGAVVCFGDVLLSPALLHRCAEDGRQVVLLDRNGRFKCRVEGPVSGNVLLRLAQYQAASDPLKPAVVARNIVAAKIQNARQVVLRAGREADDAEDAALLGEAAARLAEALPRLAENTDLNQIRGIEGDAARAYFEVFTRMIRQSRDAFRLDQRSRRPPRDPVNALLSFLYALLLNDCVAGAEGVGLDPQVGFLHALRSGRPALGLDLMEELRPVLADRLVLTLINRQQVAPGDFVARPGGAVHLTDEARKTVIIAFQKRKQDAVEHPMLRQQVPLGLLPHVQARLLARHLRGDIEEYVPFFYR
jgi:CRISPR-associated protein Cas1